MFKSSMQRISFPPIGILNIFSVLFTTSACLHVFSALSSISRTELNSLSD